MNNICRACKAIDAHTLGCPLVGSINIESDVTEALSILTDRFDFMSHRYDNMLEAAFKKIEKLEKKNDCLDRRLGQLYLLTDNIVSMCYCDVVLE